MKRIRYSEKAQKAIYYIQNKEKTGKRNREWYYKNREYYLERQRQKRHQPEEMAKTRLRNKMYRAETRRKLVQELLGGKCVRCGNDDYRVIQIDHTKGDGHAEREILHHAGGPAWWHRYYLKYPDLANKHLQLLCANCNIIKSIENHENRHYRDVPITYTVKE